MPDMIEVKVAEAEGGTLDWMVAKIDPQCSGLEWRQVAGGLAWAGFVNIEGKPTPCAFLSYRSCLAEKMRMMRDHVQPYSPSTDWAQGGPLIDRFEIELFIRATAKGRFGAGIPGRCALASDSYLLSAMRVLVWAELGDTVAVPAELVEVDHG